ncbi:MAG: DUF2934 domain-containing protein [Chthoniobacterales bacterium]|nr:DUF2934 domain-containing protein [Chthoniobacterales bacterium]
MKRAAGASAHGGKTISRSAKVKKTTSPTDEEIRIHAYFIAEQRYQCGTPGDEASDWLQAKNQLIAERLCKWIL